MWWLTNRADEFDTQKQTRWHIVPWSFHSFPKRRQIRELKHRRCQTFSLTHWVSSNQTVWHYLWCALVPIRAMGVPNQLLIRLTAWTRTNEVLTNRIYKLDIQKHTRWHIVLYTSNGVSCNHEVWLYSWTAMVPIHAIRVNYVFYWLYGPLRMRWSTKRAADHEFDKHKPISISSHGAPTYIENAFKYVSLNIVCPKPYALTTKCGCVFETFHL